MRRRINQNKLPGIALTLAIVVSIIWDSVELFDASERILRLRSASMPSNARVQALTHTPTEVDILGNALAIKNVYQIDDQQFLVIVLDGTTNRQAIHDPTHCFYSGGWTIDQTKSFPTAHGEGSNSRFINSIEKQKFYFGIPMETSNTHPHSITG